MFITTSSFSSEPRDYADRIETRIILIDATELARLRSPMASASLRWRSMS